MAKRTKEGREGAQFLASYYYGKKKINVYGCWGKETSEGEFDFFDLYEDDDEVQTCINEGAPFWTLPDYDEVYGYLTCNL